MPAPSGDFLRAELQGVEGNPLPRQHQATRLAVADQADDGCARIGLEGSPHLADHILSRIKDNHSGAGELFLRHGAHDLGADEHQVERIAWLPRGRHRTWLGGQGGEVADLLAGGTADLGAAEAGRWVEGEGNEIVGDLNGGKARAARGFRLITVVPLISPNSNRAVVLQPRKGAAPKAAIGKNLAVARAARGFRLITAIPLISPNSNRAVVLQRRKGAYVFNQLCLIGAQAHSTTLPSRPWPGPGHSPRPPHRCARRLSCRKAGCRPPAPGQCSRRPGRPSAWPGWRR